MTEKLYYTEPYISEFTAAVLSCEADGGAWRVVLDRSAFYPGGGGQPADSGTIGNAAVLSVSAEDGTVVHVTDRAVSGEVACAIDFDARFRRMQNHTGEHIVSGLFHRLYGANNVGFHMGSEDVTLDLDIELPAEDIARVEMLANRAIYENVPVTAYFPDRAELEALDYRSKLEFPEGAAVRIVRVEGYDLCACSATHVRSTGEIGVIKFLSHARYKGGVRIHMLAGQDAFGEIVREHDILTTVARKYSVKPEELGDAVRRTEDKLAQTEREKIALSRALADSMVARARTGESGEKVSLCGNCAVFFEELFTPEELRYTVNSAVGHFPAAAAFSGNDADGYLFVMSAGDGDARELLAKLKNKIAISGGGKAEMVSGRASASAGEIVRAFSEI